LTFKSGFVRQDLHVLITWQMMGFAATLYALARPWPLYNIATVGILALGIALLGLVAPLRLQMSEPGNTLANLGRFYYTKLVEAPRREASGLVRFVSDPGRWLAAADADKAKAWARIRAEHPLPQLAGTVDIIPSQQTVVIANGLDYRPRPSFQEYFTYTPRLVAANRDFFAGPLAPDWLLFAPGSIDGRYPSSAEGALWPDFLRRYRPEELNGDFLLLQRRERPLPDLFGRAQRVRAQVSHDIEVPDRGPVFAKIAIRKNWAGHLLGFLFRPGTVAIVVKAGGAEYSYRLIPEMARSGFLLSPFIDNNQNYLALAYGSHELLAARHVENFRIEFGRLARFAYDSALDIEFIPLRIDTKPPDR
jgi:hypothetical protein